MQHDIHLNNRNWIEHVCVNIKKFYAWRNFDYGVMTHYTDIVEADNLVLVDTRVSIMTQGKGHSSYKHLIVEDMHITNNITKIVSTVILCKW